MLSSDHLEGAAPALCWLQNSPALLPETPPLSKMIPLSTRGPAIDLLHCLPPPLLET